MAYDMQSWSPDFWFAEGEPYDGGPEVSERPISVWNALESMRQLHPESWSELAREVFGLEADFLTEETVLDKIRETDTCSSLKSPVRVWIDPAGYFSVHVHEATG